MQLSYLHIFYAVGRHGGFSKASKELRIQQPSISRAVKLLEDELGEILFIRHRRHVELTPAGKTVFQMAERVFSEIAATEKQIQTQCTGPQGQMNFGVSEHILNGPMVPILKDYFIKYPGVLARAFTGTSQDICQRVLSNELEFALLVTVPPEVGIKIRAIASFPSKVYILSKELKNKSVHSFFIGSREVDYTANRSFPTLDALKKRFPETEIRFSSNNLEIHKRLVLQGIGIAILPDFLVEKEFSAKLVKVFAEEYSFQTKLWLVTKTQKELSAAAVAFVKSLESGL